MTGRRLRSILIGAIAVLFAQPLGAAAPLTPKIERVALFKNGLGYFTSSVTLPEGTRVELGALPVPTLGAFWVAYPRSVALRGLFTSVVEAREQVEAPDLGALLAANVGRRVSILSTSKSDDTRIEGVILSVLGVSTERAPEPSGPYVMGPRATPARGGGAPGSVVTLQTAQGTLALNVGWMGRVQFEGGNVVTTQTRMLERPVVRAELEKPAPGEKLGLSYLARGITWSPSYRIDLSDPKLARLSASALVINEVADLAGVHLDLVTGFPNMPFADVKNPIAMSETLAQFLSAVQRAQGGPREASGALTQQAFTNSMRFAQADSQVEYPAAAGGQSSEDLFLYPVPNFSLKRGETAYLPLFSAETPYRHIYTWDVADLLDDQERYRRDASTRPPAEPVWHACRLTNPLKLPLTTAPAQFVKDGQFTGQDLCPYTPPGAEVTIPINRAANLVVEQAETETERKRDAARFQGSAYDLVKLKGELSLHNRMDRAADLEVRKELSGDVLTTTPEAADTRTAKGLRRVNTRHTLTWKVTLQPGEERQLSYAYEVFVHN